MGQVMIVEDDDRTAQAISSGIAYRWPDWKVAVVPTGEAALLGLEDKPPDLIVLDLGLPDRDGLEILQEIRATSSVPVVIVTGADEVQSRIKGLRTGADDYVVKPFSALELIARIEAVMRRALRIGANGDADRVIGSGDVRMDLEGGRVFIDGDEVQLTPVEWRLLRCLADRAEHVVSHHDLLNEVWGQDYLDHSALKVYIRRLRQKLGDNSKDPTLIKSYRGSGYMLTLENHTAETA